MHDIPMSEVTEDFANCWQAAGLHIQSQIQGQFHGWLRAHLNPPFLEHLSFRLGNQLFFIQLQDVDDVLQTPGNPMGLLSIAAKSKGHACYMPMQRVGDVWKAVAVGWGLIDAITGVSIDPVVLITDELIEMTSTELQDFAVQVVRQDLERQGFQLMSWQGNPEVDPSLWFVGKEGPEWVIVRAIKYPEQIAHKPANLGQVREQCSKLSNAGNFVSVSFAAENQSFDLDASIEPLYRGFGVHIRYEGLEKL